MSLKIFSFSSNSTNVASNKTAATVYNTEITNEFNVNIDNIKSGYISFIALGSTGRQNPIKISYVNSDNVEISLGTISVHVFGSNEYSSFIVAIPKNIGIKSFKVTTQGPGSGNSSTVPFNIGIACEIDD